MIRRIHNLQLTLDLLNLHDTCRRPKKDDVESANDLSDQVGCPVRADQLKLGAGLMKASHSRMNVACIEVNIRHRAYVVASDHEFLNEFKIDVSTKFGGASKNLLFRVIC